jgi:hypothetical protein
MTPRCLAGDTPVPDGLLVPATEPLRTLPEFTDAEIALFRSKTKPGACGTEWAGPVNIDRRRKTGAAQFRVSPKAPRLSAKRVAYFLATGRDPGTNDVTQACGNPRCLTPACLVAAPRGARLAAA